MYFSSLNFFFRTFLFFLSLTLEQKCYDIGRYIYLKSNIFIKFSFELNNLDLSTHTCTQRYVYIHTYMYV